nr:Double stranded RNA binding [Hymenolepis microstoma]
MGDHEYSVNSLRNFCKGCNFTFRQTIVDEVGLPHERLFHVQTIVSNVSKKLDIGIFDGFGHTIKIAKRNSAFAALTTLKQAKPSTDNFSKNEEANLSLILKLNEEDLLTSNSAYSDLVKLGMLFRVPVCMLKSGPDYCVLFCHCKFVSPISYVEASYKALRVGAKIGRKIFSNFFLSTSFSFFPIKPVINNFIFYFRSIQAIRAEIESLNQISIQSYAWRIEVVSRLLGLSLSFEISEMLNDLSKFSVDCILHPFTKTTASAKTLEHAKELASRLMFSQLKKFEKSPSIISSNGQKSTKHPKKFKNRVRGSSDYSGSLNPIERLELIQQANKQPEPIYNLEELYPPVKVILSCVGNKMVKSHRGPIKFLCTCNIGEIAIRGDAYCNKRLAKRSAAEKALETLGVGAYRQLKRQSSIGVAHPQLLTSLKSESNQGIKGEKEEPLPNPLQDVVSWKLLASLARVLISWGSRNNLPLSDPKAVGLDAQLLQMCSRFGIPCQLVELSGLSEKNKGWAPLQAIRAEIESLNQISIQSYAWRIEVVSRLLGLSLSFEISEMLNDLSKFSVDCILHPFTKTTASAKTLEHAKELASRLMFSQLKKFEKSPSIISSNGQKSTKHPKKFKNRVRGSSDYSGSLNPIERLELIQQANKQPEPIYNLEELYPPVKVILSCVGNKMVKSHRGPIKFLCTCNIGEIAIRGDAYCNKRLAKRSAAEKALETLGVGAYRQLKRQSSIGVAHPQLLTSLKSESNQGIKGEKEEPLPNPLQDVVSWKLLASLARVLISWGSRNNLPLSDPKAVGLDAQLLQMCSRFGIPCQLVELSGLSEKNKGWAPLQNGKFHKYAESGCTFLLQIGRTHSVSRFLSSSENLGDKFSEPKGPQTMRLKCGHSGRGGCFLSTGVNRAECRQNLALHALKCLIGPTQ